MSSVPMPRAMTEEAVAEWLYVNSDPFNESRVPWGGLYDGERNKWRFLARAVRALLREKVREAVDATKGATDPYCECDNSGTGGRIHVGFDATDAIVSRVLGDHPSSVSGGYDEPRPAREGA